MAEPERKAMLLCTSALTALLQHNLLSVSSKLLARGLITDEVSDWMLTAQGVSNLSKAQRLVSCVTDRVKGSPQQFQSFVDVLSEEPFFEEVVQKLITTYNNSESSVRAQSRGQGSPTSNVVTSSSSRTRAEPQQLPPEMYEKPKLKDAFRELLSLAAEWKTIGTLLGLQPHTLARVKADEDGVRNCLQEMLSEWLKQIDPPPTWAVLVEAVEAVSEQKAEEIRTRFRRSR